MFPPAPLRLDGWKEVASYFRRSVRTVQRWEKVLDLPIHRRNTGRTEWVYAIPAELDAWIAATDGQRESEDGVPGPDESTGVRHVGVETPAVATPASVVGAGRHGKTWRSVAVATLVGFGLMVVAAGLFAVWSRRDVPSGPAAAASLVVEHNVIVLRDASGRETGRYRFARGFPAAGSDPWLARLSVVADVDADGVPEAIVAPPLAGEPMGWVLNGDGSERARWSLPHAPAFGGASAPWTVAVPRTLLVPDPPDGTFFLAANVPDDFGAVVLHLDLAGRVLHQYWSNGYIESLRLAPGPHRTRLFVGGIHNETKGGSLAVFEGPLSLAAPATTAKYQCVGCTGEGPAAFYVFPRSGLQARLGCMAAVTAVSPRGAGRVTVQVQLGDSCTRGHHESDLEFGYYQLSPDLAVEGAWEGNGLAAAIGRLVSTGRGGLVAGDAWMGLADLFPVRRWNRESSAWDTVIRPR